MFLYDNNAQVLSAFCNFVFRHNCVITLIKYGKLEKLSKNPI